MEKLIIENGQFVWTNIVGLAAFLLVTIVFFILLYRWVQNRFSSLEHLIRKNARDVLVDIELPDGVGGTVYIDFLVLHSNGIFVLDYKDYAGVLFGGELTEQWTQVVNNKSFRFENPLYQNQQRVSVIKDLIPSGNVTGMVIFSDEGEFPRGKPDNVMLVREFRSGVLKKTSQSISPLVIDEWQGLRNKVYIDQ